MSVRVFETTAQSVLTQSRIPGLDYAVNPYVGCTHACAYCYATFMKRFMKIPDEWGAFVGVKVNAADVLVRELPKRPPGRVSFGTVCDPYQRVEEQYRVTRACLEVLTGSDEYDVGVLTKSDLVVRDVDVLERIASVEVGFTVTTLEPGIAAVLEPGAPPPARRLAAMRELASRNVDVWGFFGPVLPGVSDSDEGVREVLEAFAEAGASRILVDRLNLYPRVRARLAPLLRARLPELVPWVDAVGRNPRRYEAELGDRVRRIAEELGLGADVCF